MFTVFFSKVELSLLNHYTLGAWLNSDFFQQKIVIFILRQRPKSRMAHLDKVDNFSVCGLLTWDLKIQNNEQIRKHLKANKKPPLL